MFKLIRRIILYTISPLLIAGFFTNYKIELVNPVNRNIVFVASGEAEAYINYVKSFFESKTKKESLNNISVDDNPYSLNGIQIYRKVTNKRHFATDGYCYGKIGQCVEFVKRYYHDYLQHPFPNQWGHARDFYDPNLSDGAFNTDRALYQYKNISKRQPKVNDIIVFNNTYYGHVAIISEVTDDYIVIKQQHCKNPTKKIKIIYENNKWKIDNNGCVAFLSLTK
jgi:surface antigen